VTDRQRCMDPQRDTKALLSRIEALHGFLEAVEGVAPEERIAPARALVVRAQERLRLSRGYTVVALAGTTGSGKSSLFNAIARIELSPVGLRRPTTGFAYACVWGSSDSAPLLDWLGVPAERRFERESALDAEDEAPLRGLVLLDLPDFDSVVQSHRAEVDRLLTQVDVVVWVTDPQKYADQVMHRRYLHPFQQHRDVMVVVLNQADRLSQADTVRCVGDLRRLLEADGLDGVPVFATSAVATPPGVSELRGVLEKAVNARQATLRRLDDDLAEVTGELTGLVGAEPAETDERGAEATLANALARAAGVASVAESAARAYRRRAGWSLRWLPVRPPWRSPVAEPRPVPVHGAATGLAVRRYGQLVGAGLPEPWPWALDRAARSRLADLPAALYSTLARTEIAASRTPWWWRLATVAQWLLMLAALGGIGWWASGLLAPAFGARSPHQPMAGAVPLGLLLAAGLLVAGAALHLLLLPLATTDTRLVQERVRRRLRAGVFSVASQYVAEPVREVLGRYWAAGGALAAARGRRGSEL
jgi:GTP-binding protein EngB required for normal cell division